MSYLRRSVWVTGMLLLAGMGVLVATTSTPPLTKQSPSGTPQADDDAEAPLAPGTIVAPNGSIIWVEDFSALMQPIELQSRRWLYLVQAQPFQDYDPWDAGRSPAAEPVSLEEVTDLLWVLLSDADIYQIRNQTGMQVLDSTRVRMFAPPELVPTIQQACDYLRGLGDGEVLVTGLSGWCRADHFHTLARRYDNGDCIDGFQELLNELPAEAQQTLAMWETHLRVGEQRRIDTTVQHPYIRSLIETTRDVPRSYQTIVDTAETGTTIHLNLVSLDDPDGGRLRVQTTMTREFATTPFTWVDPEGAPLTIELPSHHIAEFGGEMHTYTDYMQFLSPGPTAGSEWVPFLVLGVDTRMLRDRICSCPVPAEYQVRARYDVLDWLAGSEAICTAPYRQGVQLDQYDPPPAASENTRAQASDRMENLVDHLVEIADLAESEDGLNLQSLPFGYVEIDTDEETHAIMREALLAETDMTADRYGAEVIIRRLPRQPVLPGDPRSDAAEAGSMETLADTYLVFRRGQGIRFAHGFELSVVRSFGPSDHTVPGPALPRTDTEFVGISLSLEAAPSPSFPDRFFLVHLEGILTGDVPGSERTTTFQGGGTDGGAAQRLPLHDRAVTSLDVDLLSGQDQWGMAFLPDANHPDQQIVIYVRMFSEDL